MTAQGEPDWDGIKTMTQNDLLSPRTYGDVRKPVTEAGTLPPHCYTTQDWYDAEVRADVAP